MKTYLLLTCSVLAFSFSHVGFAADGTRKLSDKLEVCPALTDEKSYKSNAGYKFLIAGKDDIVFRTYSDFEKLEPMSEYTLHLYNYFATELKKRGTDLVTLYLPPRSYFFKDKIITMQPNRDADFDPITNFDVYNANNAAIHKQGVNSISFENIDGTKPFYFKQDHHWSPEGAQEGARRAAKVIQNLPVFKEIARATFETTQLNEPNRVGPFAEFIAKTCKTSPIAEKMHTYQTIQKTSDQSSNALFDDKTDAPYIALAGTSNSNEESSANFAGWLRQNLSTDVQNFSLSGAGAETILSFVHSPEFQKHTPKILLWESHSSYSNKIFENTLKQSIPYLFSDCTEKDSLQDTNISIKKSSEELPINFRNTAFNKSFVILDFSTVPEKAKISFLYKDAKKEVLELARSNYAGRAKDFRILLDKYNLSDLDKVTIDFSDKKSLPKSLTVRFCGIEGKNYSGIDTSDEPKRSSKRDSDKNVSFIDQMKKFFSKED